MPCAQHDNPLRFGDDNCATLFCMQDGALLPELLLELDRSLTDSEGQECAEPNFAAGAAALCMRAGLFANATDRTRILASVNGSDAGLQLSRVSSG